VLECECVCSSACERERERATKKQVLIRADKDLCESIEINNIDGSISHERCLQEIAQNMIPNSCAAAASKPFRKKGSSGGNVECKDSGFLVDTVRCRIRRRFVAHFRYGTTSASGFLSSCLNDPNNLFSINTAQQLEPSSGKVLKD